MSRCEETQSYFLELEFSDMFFYNFTQLAPMEGTSIFFLIYLYDRNTQNNIMDLDLLSAFHIDAATNTNICKFEFSTICKRKFTFLK